jgi:hypothetical protein
MEYVLRWIMESLAAWIGEYLLSESDDWFPRTLLGWTRVGLLAGLMGKVIYLIHTFVASSVPTILWYSLPANFLALLVVRRALRWRYPV